MVVVVYSAELARRWLKQLCFRLAILLVKGERSALAPIYLGSLYACLDECITNIAQLLGRSDVVMHVDSSFLQMFLWERFGALALKSNEYSSIMPKRLEEWPARGG